MSLTEQILSQQPDNVLERLRGADKFWTALRSQQLKVPQVVTESKETLGETDWDLVICGGTLGILLGAACAKLGWRVALIERGI